MKKTLGYFYCSESVLWTVFTEESEGKEVYTSNFPRPFAINGNEVQELGNDGHGEFIEETYTLWSSLVELAIEVECVNNKPEVEGEVSLQEAVNESYIQVRDFKRNWLENREKEPEYYPLSFPLENAGSWFEQIQQHEVSSTQH